MKSFSSICPRWGRLKLLKWLIPVRIKSECNAAVLGFRIVMSHSLILVFGNWFFHFQSGSSSSPSSLSSAPKEIIFESWFLSQTPSGAARVGCAQFFRNTPKMFSWSLQRWASPGSQWWYGPDHHPWSARLVSGRRNLRLFLVWNSIETASASKSCHEGQYGHYLRGEANNLKKIPRVYPCLPHTKGIST
jgi:hypothetical protein